MVMCVSIVSNRPRHVRYRATNVKLLYVPNAIGVMNIMPNMRFESVIAVMPFCVEIVMKWINATIVETSYVPPVQPCSVVNSVEVDCVKSVPPLVPGTLRYVFSLKASVVEITSIVGSGVTGAEWTFCTTSTRRGEKVARTDGRTVGFFFCTALVLLILIAPFSFLFLSSCCSDSHLKMYRTSFGW